MVLQQTVKSPADEPVKSTVIWGVPAPLVITAPGGTDHIYESTIGSGVT